MGEQIKIVNINKIYLGADHGGYRLKKELKKRLGEMGCEVVDCGAYNLNPEDDYPDFAAEVAKQILSSKSDNNQISNRGIVICRNGVGVCIVANKFRGVRCALGFDKIQIKKAREDDDVNVLALPADYLTSKKAEGIVKTFLITEFSGKKRHIRRLKKIDLISNCTDF